MAIIQYRLDGRMLHGQVSAFGKNLYIEEFVVVNEKTANDPTQIMLLEIAALGADVDVLSPEDALDLIESGEIDDYRSMVVFKEIKDVVELVKLGYKFDELVISGMYKKEGTGQVKYEASLFVNDEDKEAFRYLDSEGITLSHQIALEYPKKSVKSLVKY